MVYTHENISELLPDMTPRKIPGAVASGLPGRKIGRTWYFDEGAVRAWLAGQQEQSAQKLRTRIAKAAQDDPSRYHDEFGGEE